MTMTMKEKPEVTGDVMCRGRIRWYKHLASGKRQVGKQNAQEEL